MIITPRRHVHISTVHKSFKLKLTTAIMEQIGPIKLASSEQDMADVSLA